MGYISELDIVSGEKKLLATKIASSIIDMMDIICNSKIQLIILIKMLWKEFLDLKRKKKIK